jgi:hypothetical protein
LLQSWCVQLGGTASVSRQLPLTTTEHILVPAGTDAGDEAGSVSNAAITAISGNESRFFIMTASSSRCPVILVVCRRH